MDTSTGRFISQDTYQGSINDPVSLHKYLYANSNPVTYTDPSGYYSKTELMVTGLCMAVIAAGCIIAAMSSMRNGLSILSELNSVYDSIDSFTDTVTEIQLEAQATFYGYTTAWLLDSIAEPIDSILSFPIHGEERAIIESMPIPEAQPQIEVMPIPENEVGVEVMPIPVEQPSVEKLPVGEGHIPQITTIQITGRIGSLPAKKAEYANKVVELFNNDGKLVQKRYYDSEGKAQLDIDCIRPIIP